MHFFLKVETDHFILLFYYYFFFFLPFLGPLLQHMKIPSLGVKLELQLLAYATATAILDPSHVFDLYHSLRQSWIPDPLSESRDQTCILMDTSQISFCCATMGTPFCFIYLFFGHTWSM